MRLQLTVESPHGIPHAEDGRLIRGPGPADRARSGPQLCPGGVARSVVGAQHPIEALLLVEPHDGSVGCKHVQHDLIRLALHTPVQGGLHQGSLHTRAALGGGDDERFDAGWTGVRLHQRGMHEPDGLRSVFGNENHLLRIVPHRRQQPRIGVLARRGDGPAPRPYALQRALIGSVIAPQTDDCRLVTNGGATDLHHC